MSLGLKESALTRTIKASRKLSAGAGEFPPVTAVTASNRYLRRFLPASAGNSIRETFYLRPSKVILHPRVLQCWLPSLSKLFLRRHFEFLPKCATSDRDQNVFRTMIGSA